MMQWWTVFRQEGVETWLQAQARKPMPAIIASAE
jgi:hypothetical protein